jgi:hypothetical protein
MKNLLLIVVVMATLGSPDLFAERKYAPMPDKVLQAKTVYLDDQSGYPGVGDKAYQELTKWGRFKVVTTRKEADLIMLISARAYTGGYMTNSSGQVYPTAGGGAYGTASSVRIPLVAIFGYLTLIDPSDGEAVWTETKRARWGAGHTVHIIFDELRKRINEQESATAKK